MFARTRRISLNAKTVLSGALAASRRRAFSTSRSAGEARTTRRARTTLSMRPRPTAPANSPTVRCQSVSSGCVSTTVSGATTGRATRAPGACPSSRARDRSRSQRRIPADPTASTVVVVNHVPSGVPATVHSGRTSEAAPNGSQVSSAAGRRPVKLRPPRRTGPTPRGRPASRPPARCKASQAAPAVAKRSGPSGSVAQARPTPTRANPSDGRSQMAASTPASTAAA